MEFDVEIENDQQFQRIVCFSSNSSVDFPFDEGASALCYIILVTCTKGVIKLLFVL